MRNFYLFFILMIIHSSYGLAQNKDGKKYTCEIKKVAKDSKNYSEFEVDTLKDDVHFREVKPFKNSDDKKFYVICRGLDRQHSVGTRLLACIFSSRPPAKGGIDVDAVFDIPLSTQANGERRGAAEQNDPSLLAVSIVPNDADHFYLKYRLSDSQYWGVLCYKKQ